MVVRPNGEGHVEEECIRKVLDGPTFYHRITVSQYTGCQIYSNASVESILVRKSQQHTTIRKIVVEDLFINLEAIEAPYLPIVY